MSIREEKDQEDDKDQDEKDDITYDDGVQIVKLEKPLMTDVSFVKEYDWSTSPENAVILCCSIRRSGKSVITHQIAYELRKRFKHCYLFSPTYNLQTLDGDRPLFYFVPKGNRYEKFDEGLLEDIINKQKEIYLSNNRLPKAQQRRPKVLVILDDILSDDECLNSPSIKNLCVNGRHYGISIMILVQELNSRNGFKTYLRNQTDIFISFRIFQESTRKMASENFLSIISRKDGESIINSITQEDYTAIIVDKSKKTHNYETFVFKYRAPEPKKIKDFIVGEEDKDFMADNNNFTENSLGFQLVGRNETNFVLKGSYLPKNIVRLDTEIGSKPLIKKIKYVGARAVARKRGYPESKLIGKKVDIEEPKKTKNKKK